MSLKIHRVKNSNDPQKEFVILKATGKVNLKDYAIVDKTFDSGGKISNEFRHFYNLPNLEINLGEWAFICTGTGKNRVINQDSKIIHLLHWNAKECVWNDQGGDTATLIKFDVINSVTVPPIDKE
ncbi:hypothetical protein SAMN05444671_4159 [Flavobacterium sp. CF108]|uniref:hypothetical protein n=1 Tax=unclassified Flavobacterium TaxID=196869 RepID=UPI0008B912A7|nr:MULTISPECIES: hypothetical protein [unclassified Flavobacterium]SEO68296.1 hypothetical protein SAMN04487978_3413 [Flavobacterium sp. fv08]SHH89824.1 hypothetical protein SAMN05444671_4159 [Flavobacterium sp. CF108]